MKQGFVDDFNRYRFQHPDQELLAQTQNNGSNNPHHHQILAQHHLNSTVAATFHNTFLHQQAPSSSSTPSSSSRSLVKLPRKNTPAAAAVMIPETAHVTHITQVTQTTHPSQPPAPEAADHSNDVSNFGLAENFTDSRDILTGTSNSTKAEQVKVVRKKGRPRKNSGIVAIVPPSTSTTPKKRKTPLRQTMPQQHERQTEEQPRNEYNTINSNTEIDTDTLPSLPRISSLHSQTEGKPRSFWQQQHCSTPLQLSATEKGQAILAASPMNHLPSPNLTRCASSPARLPLPISPLGSHNSNGLGIGIFLNNPPASSPGAHISANVNPALIYNGLHSWAEHRMDNKKKSGRNSSPVRKRKKEKGSCDEQEDTNEAGHTLQLPLLPQYSRIFNSPIQYPPYFHSRTSTYTSIEDDPFSTPRRPPYLSSLSTPLIDSSNHGVRKSRKRSSGEISDFYHSSGSRYLLSSPPTSAGPGQFRRTIRFSVSPTGYASVDVDIVQHQESPSWGQDYVKNRSDIDGKDEQELQLHKGVVKDMLQDCNNRESTRKSVVIRYNSSGGKEKPKLLKRRRTLNLHSDYDGSDGYVSEAETVRVYDQ